MRYGLFIVIIGLLFTGCEKQVDFPYTSDAIFWAAGSYLEDTGGTPVSFNLTIGQQVPGSTSLNQEVYLLQTRNTITTTGVLQISANIVTDTSASALPAFFIRFNDVDTAPSGTEANSLWTRKTMEDLITSQTVWPLGDGPGMAQVGILALYQTYYVATFEQPVNEGSLQIETVSDYDWVDLLGYHTAKRIVGSVKAKAGKTDGISVDSFAKQDASMDITFDLLLEYQ